MANLRLAIVQDYVPQFRLQFFDELIRELAATDIDCGVIAGRPPGVLASRGDAVKRASWLKEVEPRELTVGRQGPRFYGYGTDCHWRDCDGIIMALRGTSLDLNMELVRKRFSARRVGVWGHISHTIKPPNAIDLAIERWQMRRSDHVFAYTESGVEVAISAGVHSGDVTAVMNSTDVAELLSAYEAFSEVELTRMLDEYVLTPGKTFGFIGGLDGPKRISFLAEVLDRMWYIDQQVKVLIGGTGAEDKLLTGAVNRGQVVMFGYAGPQEKAAIMRLSQAILSPGRIGLLAIDCLAVGIPILATEWKYHAPEFEYLEQGKDVIISANDVTSYIELLLKSTTTECKLETRSGRPYPSVEQMVQRFAGGVKSMMLD